LNLTQILYVIIQETKNYNMLTALGQILKISHDNPTIRFIVGLL